MTASSDSGAPPAGQAPAEDEGLREGTPAEPLRADVRAGFFAKA